MKTLTCTGCAVMLYTVKTRYILCCINIPVSITCRFELKTQERAEYKVIQKVDKPNKNISYFLNLIIEINTKWFLVRLYGEICVRLVINLSPDVSVACCKLFCHKAHVSRVHIIFISKQISFYIKLVASCTFITWNMVFGFILSWWLHVHLSHGIWYLVLY